MQVVEKITYSNVWVTLVLLFLFLLIFLLKITNALKLKQVVLSFSDFSQIEEDEEGNTKFFSSFKFLIFVFSAVIFSLLVSSFIGSDAAVSGSFGDFISIFAGVITYLILKKLIEKAILSVFMIDKHLSVFINSKSNSLHSVSFLLYVFIILYQYENLSNNSLLYFTIAIFLFRFIFLIFKNKNLIFNKLFYFILYICTLEIAPLFILFKLMF